MTSNPQYNEYYAYIADRRAEGIPDETIKEYLKRAGYSDDLITQLFEAMTADPESESSSNESSQFLVPQETTPVLAVILFVVSGIVSLGIVGLVIVTKSEWFTFSSVEHNITAAETVLQEELQATITPPSNPSLCVGPLADVEQYQISQIKNDFAELATIEDDIAVASDADEVMRHKAVYNYLSLRVRKILHNINATHKSALGDALLDDIYQQYCVSPRTLDIASYATIEDVELYQLTTYHENACSLNMASVPESAIPLALSMLANKLMNQGDVNRALPFYMCAAEQYYSPDAMYELAQLYSYGTEHLAKVSATYGVPITFNAVIPINLKHASFWINSVLALSSVHGFVYARDDTSYLNELEYLKKDIELDGSIPFRDRVAIREEALDFLEPVVKELQTEVIVNAELIDAYTFLTYYFRFDAEFFYDGNGGTYDGVCSVLGKNTRDSSVPLDGLRCTSGPDWYVVEFNLPESKFYCVDATGTYGPTERSSVGYQTCQ